MRRAAARQLAGGRARRMAARRAGRGAGGRRRRHDGDAGRPRGADRQPRAARHRAPVCRRRRRPRRRRARHVRLAAGSRGRSPRSAIRARSTSSASLLLAPDLVVTWPFAAPAQVGALVARGVPVFIANPATIDGIALDLERLGTLAGTLPIATARAAEFRARLARLQARYAGARTVRVFYEIWNAPLYTIGGNHLISQALRVCGGENVFAALTLPAPGRERRGGARREAGGDPRRRGRRRAPGVARRLEALADAPRGRARQSFHRRRESAASRGTAVHRRRRAAVRDAGEARAGLR